MAKYDPPQPLWKRNLAGILDFLLAFLAFGYILSRIFGNAPHPTVVTPAGQTTELFSLQGWPALMLFALIVAYFVALGRTGGTILQRALGMKRAK